PTHKEIASRVGTSREEVTRELSHLARLGLLERARRVFMLRDVAALEKLVADSRPEDDRASAVQDEASHLFTLGSPQRRRRAVLVADVLDSSSLRERDEERSLEQKRAFFAHATSEVIPTHAGRSLSKVLGDGFLAEFPDAVQAARCAFELHR